jgi:6-phosphogluconate dehydrogenase
MTQQLTTQPRSACEIGVIGMGVMGLSLARNFASKGLSTAIWDRTADKSRAVTAQHPEAQFTPHADLGEFVASLERPRRIVLMILAGAPVDEMIHALEPLLDAEDIVIDAGNSLFTDTDRRATYAAGKPWRFVGMGVSGGEEGALLGPSMMPGGDVQAWQRLQPAFEKIAARGPRGVCVAHCGKGSAGHFVKMVHNGIEYGDMQLIAETATLLRDGLGLPPADIADTFGRWNAGELESFLIEITADIHRVMDPAIPGQLLLDQVVDRAGQKGTGRWTVIAAAELGVAIPTIAAAVDARIVSAQAMLRAQVGAALVKSQARTPGIHVDDLRDALLGAKIASYAQGFELLAKASADKGYGTDLAEVARIWTAGCIIRAGFLDHVSAAFAGGRTESLVLAPHFTAELRRRLPGWRRVVVAALNAGIAVPGLATSLAWLDNLATARGSAALLQAQRDYFGAHTYERLDTPGVSQHSDWKAMARGA